MLRLEDTDRERLVPEAAEQIKASHEWLGLVPDEVFVQSERLKIYRQHADTLTAKGALYPCWCTPERLNDLRDAAKAAKKPFKYDRHCLSSPGQPDQPHVLRFQIPDAAKVIGWEDAVRGHLSFAASDLDDFVAIKSDGYPTYNFANVVDDHAMEISHVLRAEEFLSSTPKHLLLYEAFGWEPPVFAHLPQVLSSDGKSKLSKRLGAKPVLDYRDEGYLPEAVINFLALLGWNEGEGSTKEIYSRHELIQAFSLERIQKSPAVFDQNRLDWMNGEYLRAMPAKELTKRLEPFVGRYSAAWKSQPSYALAVTKLIQDRLKRLSEAPELIGFFFDDPALAIKTFQNAKLDPTTAAQYINATLTEIEQISSDFSQSNIEQSLRSHVAKKLNLEKMGPLFMAVRIALTGSTATPPLFETMAVLGRDRVINRLKAAAQLLKHPSN